MITYFRRHPTYYKYFISTHGDVLSFRQSRPRFLHQQQLNHGHWVVSLGKGQKKLVHRLVLETFVGPCPNGMEACHKNDNPTDNRLDNLRWDTHSENQKDRVRNGNWFNPGGKHELHGNHKLTEDDVKLIRASYEIGGCSQRELAKTFNVGKTTIAHVVNYDTWR